MTDKKKTFGLALELDPASGMLLRLTDPQTDVTVFHADGSGTELEWNGVPLRTTLVHAEEGAREHHTVMVARLAAAYGTGATLEIKRILTLGGGGLHTGRSQSVHIRYEIRRAANAAGDGMDYVWQPEIESPLRLESLGVLVQGQRWFGEKTRMRAVAIGGSGPREHVSLEDGPVREVVPYLQTAFRTTFPGQQTINGALYYLAAGEPYVWIVVRHPTTGGRIAFGENRHGYRFFYFKDVPVADEFMTPAVSLFWGRGLDDSDRVLAEQFDRFEEPPAWWYNTAWFWLHPAWQPDGSFDLMGKGAEILLDCCGVTGFGLTVHDVPWAGNDIDVANHFPAPVMGGDDHLRRAVARLRDKGAHTYLWVSRTGHRSDNLTWQESWAVKGADGRPIRLHNRPDAGVRIDVYDCADPSYQQYIFEVIRYYVQQLGVTGFFWDSGLQPMPPDFGGKPYLKWPGECMAWTLEFYERVYRYGKSLDPDFFMWVEGISADARMNAFAVDNRSHGPASGHALMHRIAHKGPKRLVWRSAWAHDVASAMPFIAPQSDVGRNPQAAFYQKAAVDPMNLWLCRMLKERGCRQAVGVADGVGVLDEFVVVCPGQAKSVTVPEALCGGKKLQSVVTEATVPGRRAAGGLLFDLPADGAWRFC